MLPALLVLIPVLLGSWIPALAEGSLESRIQAAYIYNFLLFVDWPGSEDGGGSAKDPLQVCILGVDPVGPLLQPITRREVRGHPVELVQLRRGEHTRGCRLLLVAGSEEGRLGAVLEEVAEDPILTVSAIPAFATRGGMIGFVLHNGRIRPEINLMAARAAGLRISSKLLEVASRVIR